MPSQSATPPKQDWPGGQASSFPWKHRVPQEEAACAHDLPQTLYSAGFVEAWVHWSQPWQDRPPGQSESFPEGQAWKHSELALVKKVRERGGRRG